MADSTLKPPTPPAAGYVPVGSGNKGPSSVLPGTAAGTPTPAPSPSASKPPAPQPTSTPLIATVPPQAQPPQPASPPPAAPVASAAPQQFRSPILQGASTMSAQPFQDPTKNPVAPPPSVIKAPQQGSSSPALGNIGSIPKESAGFALPTTPASGGAAGTPPKTPVAAKAGGGGLFGQSKLLLGAAVGLVLLLIVGGGAFFFLNNNSETPVTGSPAPKATKNVQLTYWGLWEPAEVMQSLITEYEQANPGVKIAYTQQKSEQYRQRVQAAIRDGSGPDILRYHNTWMPMMSGDLAPAARNTVTVDELKDNFYPAVSLDLVKNNQVFGVPLMYEGLALLYNESMLQAANATPPKDWEQLRQLANSLTVKSGTRIERAGIALGTASNVDNFSDILALMMLQNSANPDNPVTDNERHALTFYTLFTRTDAIWDESMPSSTLAFANEKAAMAILPSWRIFEIREMNPNLKFGVARLPQLSDQTITWASYWAEGVSKQSKNQEEAWKFLAWLSQAEQLRNFHSQAASVRGFGELYPRVEMAAELKDNAFLSPYLDDALYGRSWHLASMTHDEGLNDKLIQYYTDAVNQMNQRGNAEQAFQQVLPGIQQVLSQYSLSVPAAAAATP